MCLSEGVDMETLFWYVGQVRVPRSSGKGHREETGYFGTKTSLSLALIYQVITSQGHLKVKSKIKL